MNSMYLQQNTQPASGFNHPHYRTQAQQGSILAEDSLSHQSLTGSSASQHFWVNSDNEMGFSTATTSGTRVLYTWRHVDSQAGRVSMARGTRQAMWYGACGANVAPVCCQPCLTHSGEWTGTGNGTEGSASGQEGQCHVHGAVCTAGDMKWAWTAAWSINTTMSTA